MSTAVRVRVPATSANLGPGLDSLGIALGLHNEITVRTARSGAAVSIEGEGAERFATGEGNLVVRSARAALDDLGIRPPGLVLHCVNRIPSARGLGSSAASIVAGVVAGAALAGAMAGVVADGPLVDLEWALALCARLEGHPDNVAACLLGGTTIAWYEATGRARAVRAEPAVDLLAVALVPPARVSTAEARRLLPAHVTLGDAAHSAGRAALMSLALTTRPDLLLPATEDRLHQAYREPAMPVSLRLLERLRERGLAAVISGAGPSVLVLGSARGEGGPTAAEPSGAALSAARGEGGPTPAEPAGALTSAVAAVGVEGFDIIPLRPDLDGVSVSAIA